MSQIETTQYVGRTLVCFVMLSSSLVPTTGLKAESINSRSIRVRVDFFFEAPPAPDAISLVVKSSSTNSTAGSIESTIAEPRTYELVIREAGEVTVSCVSSSYWCPDVQVEAHPSKSEIYVPVFPAVLAAPPRTVQHNYTKGLATEVVGYAPEISYQAGGMLHQIEHANGVTYTVEVNPADGLERPNRISTTAGWDTGTYAYDGSGNIHRIGTESFRYDRLNRLVSGQVKVGSVLRTQTVSYDVYGNITSLTTDGSIQSTATDASSNRLLSPLANYDGAGNVTVLDYGTERYEYEYDGVNMMKHLRSDTDLARIYLYNAADERIAQFDCATGVCETPGSSDTWTIRSLDNKVLRTYVRSDSEGWQWKDDFVHGDEGLLAVVKPSPSGESVTHIHLDHLRTTRQSTSGAGTQEAFHSYYPFGREATSPAVDDVALKFTGHERDSNGAGHKGDIDYMHARFCSPEIGRFMATDPKRSGARQAPQSWNEYHYAGNNPLKFIDPDGEEIRLGLGSHHKALEATRRSVDPSLRSAIQLGTNSAGNTILTVNNSVQTNDINFKNIQRTINSPGIVELNLVKPSTEINLKRRSGKQIYLPMAQANKRGFTLPSEGTARGNDELFSTVKGITQVFVTDDTTSVDLAPVVAAEIGAHALPALLGKGASPSDRQEHIEREEPLVEAARENAKRE